MLTVSGSNRLTVKTSMEQNSAITLRKHKTGQAPEGNDALQLSDLYNLLQSVETRLSERLSVIEKAFMERLQLDETSLEHAYNNTFEIRCQICDTTQSQI